MPTYTERDKVFIDMAFVSILSFQFHPGNHAVLTQDAIDHALHVAIMALETRNKTFGD